MIATCILLAGVVDIYRHLIECEEMLKTKSAQEGRRTLARAGREEI